MKHLLTLSALSGGTLLALLPLGVWCGINSPLFTACFIVHLVIHAAALVGNLFSSRTHPLGLLLIVSLACLALMSGLHPATARDALIHHLAVPQWWIQSGNLAPLPWHEWSYYPMLLQLAFAGFLKCGAEFGASLYHGSYLLLGALLTARFLHEEYDDRAVSSFGGTLIAGLPIAMNLAGSPLVDLALYYYSLAAIISIITAVRDHSWRWGAIAGTFLGFAYGVKYNAIPFIGAALLFALLLSVRRKMSLGVRGAFIAALLGSTAIVASPWCIQNFAAVGNPIYPLFQSYFSAARAAPAPALPRISGLQHRLLIEQESMMEVLATPVRMILFGKDGSPANYDGVLTPLLLLAFIPLLLRGSRTHHSEWMAPLTAATLLYFLIALSQTSWRIRYLAPIFGPLTIFAAVGALRLRDAMMEYRIGHQIAAFAIPALIIVQAALASSYGILRIQRDEVIPYLRGELSTEQYLTRHLTEYPTVAFVNKNLPLTSKLYLLYTSNQFYYYQRPVFSSGYNSERKLVQWIRDSKQSEDIATAMRQEQFTHLVTNRRLLVTALPTVLSREQQLRWNEFSAHHLRELYTSGDYTVWEVA